MECGPKTILTTERWHHSDQLSTHSYAMLNYLLLINDRLKHSYWFKWQWLDNKSQSSGLKNSQVHSYTTTVTNLLNKNPKCRRNHCKTLLQFVTKKYSATLLVTRWLTESSAYQPWQSIIVSHRAVEQFNSWDSSINMSPPDQHNIFKVSLCFIFII